jgi:hypothetical protein
MNLQSAQSVKASLFFELKEKRLCSFPIKGTIHQPLKIVLLIGNEISSCTSTAKEVQAPAMAKFSSLHRQKSRALSFVPSPSHSYVKGTFHSVFPQLHEQVCPDLTANCGLCRAWPTTRLFVVFQGIVLQDKGASSICQVWHIFKKIRPQRSQQATPL